VPVETVAPQLVEQPGQGLLVVLLVALVAVALVVVELPEMNRAQAVVELIEVETAARLVALALMARLSLFTHILLPPLVR
jgi:hypothetical protein